VIVRGLAAFSEVPVGGLPAFKTTGLPNGL
jgi:hypothetical protein